MHTIDSIKDERIAAARALSTRAGRLAAGRCLIEGASLIRQVLDAGASLCYALHAEEDTDLRAELLSAGVPVHVAREGLLRKVIGSAKPVSWLAVAVLPPEVGRSEPYGDFALVCDKVADPGNLGTIVRTARALGVRDIVLTDESTDLGSRRVLDAARGAVLGARVRRFADPLHAVKSLQGAGFQVVVTSPRGPHLQSLAPLRGGKVALVVGNETDGVDEATVAAADLVVQIPMAGAVESLNVGVATGISIYELRMRMVLAMLTDRIRNTLGRDLGVAGKLVRRAFDARLREVGDLDSTQVVLLMVLACERTTALTQLRKDVGVDVQDLDAALAPMAQRGYLTIDASQAMITAHGEQAIAALWTVQERVEEELYAGFSEQERHQLRSLLRRIQDNAIRVGDTAVPLESKQI
ncbi:TrmH family RNA methyltransferase [Kibdelosporangium banguiense]|uniref:TrmH family RNA methyltransferase n=1 Tax=Kibdelosporangium banguiense TaxID=1365924 RepID=A0ABS4TYY2_9PSEU|nr:TrmH family RNA methyltransferase [Kibdelosporangium banguiense]MBP2329623.1 TrmH family RNA methyltransferase [Kibdelosporangium banguiense]